MEVRKPDGCGNAPRVEIVCQIVEAWAERDAQALREWLDESVVWSTAGGRAHRGADEVRDLLAGLPMVTDVELRSVLTHGREASCHGVVTTGDGACVEFAHSIMFRGAGKTAPVTAVTTFMVERE